MNNNIKNPLIERVDCTPRAAYPFSIIKNEHFREAFDYAIAKKRCEIDAIINNEEEATFQNTILALEYAAEDLEYVSSVFFNLLHSNSSDELMAISEEVIPILSELSTEITLNEKLFNRVNHVYQNREKYNLDIEDARLLKNCYDGFNESGATLGEKDKNRLRELSMEMSQNTLNFGNNLLKEQRLFKKHITDESILSDMPKSIIDIYREAAAKAGYNEGALFDLSMPSYFAIMQHCPDREIRKEFYFAKSSLGAKDNEFDNRPLIIDIVNGKLEESNLLSHPNFASLALEHRMAKNEANVYELLNKLLEAYKEKGRKEIDEISIFAKEQGAETPLKSWDWSYWSEQYKKKYFEIDDEEYRPYFELNNVIDAVFSLATNLYGIHFTKRNDIDVYHEDVEVFEVSDEDGSYLGLLYTDFFPREGKQNGAWMSSFKDQFIKDGEDHRPHIVLVMNFTPKTSTNPSLLTMGEVSTFLHEFGHALHGMLSKVRYASLSGTSVARDFVELPSQLMENWLAKSEWVKSIAKHYQTGETIPQNLIDKKENAKHFLVGYATCRQLSFGFLDMAYHTINEPLSKDIDLYKFENEAWSKALLLDPMPEGTMMSTSFSHIFSGGYSAGYYGYKWAEVLDADAFEYFMKDNTLYNREVAEKFRRNILERGDVEDAMILYRNFRGQNASIDALLRRDFIIK